MEPTREQLQAEILEILYQKCLQKPIWVSCAEIFWSISNLKVSERSVKDVLDWLVKNDLVIYQADKYQIAKREFMDISRRKALEKKETEENAEVRTVEYGTSIPPHTMNHHPWLEREYQQPVAKSSNTMFAIIALIAFLISGTLVGILLFNSFATERRNNAELTYLPDSIQVPSLQVSTPGYIRDAYTTNRNFKNIHPICISSFSVSILFWGKRLFWSSITQLNQFPRDISLGRRTTNEAYVGSFIFRLILTLTVRKPKLSMLSQYFRSKVP